MTTQPQAWPDWSGRAVAIVASGPSARKAGVEQLRGVMPVLAVKRSLELCPWADAVYGCDMPWWRSVEGLPRYNGVKLAYAVRARDEYGCLKVDIPDVRCDHLLFGKVGTVGAGGNSGFQALNLAVQFGASRILLIGFDMHLRGGVHWYGRNTACGMSNPEPSMFRRWIAAYVRASAQLVARGVEVINASPGSDLTVFPKASVAETIARWSADRGHLPGERMSA